ncbi:hypothetical protein AB0I49_05260 [Streptomyces sp. NPDC050617]|uniref:hypothetical protein n=1 Tax=Streptomyces sp. NPDC050617 TaxID=3154628 RepID=UPI003442DF6C
MQQPAERRAPVMSGTRTFLVRRLTALLTLTALSFAALLAAYYGVSRNSGAVTGGTAPAIVQISSVRDALARSYDSARQGLGRDTADIEGPGENYRSALSTANQNLAQAIKGTVAGDSGRQSLRTVTGLVASYADLVQQAYVNRDNPVLRDAYLGYARDMLRSGGSSGILDRLQGLQRQQLGVLERQASFGWVLWLTWIVACALFAALGWLLVDTQRFLRRRFRRLVNPFLAAATALLAVLLPLALFTGQTQDRLASARTLLAARTSSSTTPQVLPEVLDTMQDTHWRAGVVGLIPLGGTVLAALVLAGLQPRIDEYRFQPR